MRPISKFQFAALAVASTRGAVRFGDTVTYEDIAPFLAPCEFVDISGSVAGRTLATLTDLGLLVPEVDPDNPRASRAWSITPAGRKALEGVRT